MAGVSKERYDQVIQVDSSITFEEVVDRLDFLKSIQAEFRNLHYIYNLATPEVWENYLLLGERTLPEQLALKQAKKILRKAWRMKYGKQKKATITKDDSGDSNEESIQPEE